MRPIASEYRHRVNELVKFPGRIDGSAWRGGCPSINRPGCSPPVVGDRCRSSRGRHRTLGSCAALRPLNQAVSVANQLAESGDLAVRIDVVSGDETGMLLASMKNMVEKLSQIITEVRSAADNLPALKSQCHGAVVEPGIERTGRQRRGNQCLDRTDVGIDQSEHRERQR